jgi:hypothetical protein
MKIWSATISEQMVEGWSAELVDELKRELDDAVERIFTEIKGGK